jgi:uncharacterized protein YdeI (BOF family)
MKISNNAVLIASLTALMSTSALAANDIIGIDAVKKLKDGTQVSLTGTVDSVKSEREFTLRDKTGTLDIDIESNESVILKPGDNVAINGVVDSGLTGTDVNASKVMVRKDIVSAVGDAIESNTGMSLEGAETYTIKTLPKEGLVKVSGTVTDVDNERHFTIKDKTGSVDVEMTSNEKAVLTEGAEVTVIGYVADGLLSKDIKASKVLVLADAKIKH